MAVIFPSDEYDYLPAYPVWEAPYSLAMLTVERDYEDDYSELDRDPFEYYEGLGEYVRPEMDCS